MPSRIFGPWCLVFGHRRAAASRRTEEGNVFGSCAVCGRDMFREPVKGKWRIATYKDRRARGFALMDEAAVAPAPKRSRASSRKR